jgi:hypothetical protein
MKLQSIKVMAAFALLFLVFACDQDFAEINTNPNQPTVDKANPDLILPKIISEVGDEMTSDLAWGFGNIVSQLVATNNFTGVDIYNWGTQSGTWNLLYRNARDAQNLEIIAEERGNNNLKAVALVLKSYIFSNLTELWGDIPYTQALAGKGINGDPIFEPGYDAQKDIYAGILADYAEADKLFGTSGSLGGDIMFAGDINKWKKLTNSLRVRTLMRLEKKWGEMGLSANDLQQLVSEGNLMESNADNAILPYLATSPNQWPLQTSRVGSFDEKRMSQRVENVLKSTNDPRLGILFRTVDNQDTPGVYAGVANGLSEDNAINFNGGPKNQSRLGKRFRDTDEPANVKVDMTFMQYNELMFLLAEAAEKGYINGDAATYYLAGINATMDYYGATPTADYFAQTGVDYKSAATQTERLELIGTQKWLGLFMVGLEAWFDFRRTGIPALTPGSDALFQEVPVRVQYPDDEKVLNGSNYDAAVSRQGADEILTPTWLLK